MKHYFQTPNPDLSAVQKRLVNWFKDQGFEVNAADADGEYLIQARKTGTFRALTGTNQAFTVKLCPSGVPDEFVFENSIGAWKSNLTGVAISAFFTGGLTLMTGAAGVAWAKKIEGDIVAFVETTLKFKKTKTVDEKGIAVSTAADAPAPAALPVAAPPAAPVARTSLSAQEKAVERVQAECKKIQEAHAAGILTDEEYEAKRKDIQAKTAEYEVQFTVEERGAKLKAALEQGILEQAEYQAKLAALEKAVRAEIEQQRQVSQKEGQIARLKAALEQGILSQREYEAKVAALGK